MNFIKKIFISICSSNTPPKNSYYVFTTFDSLNLPHFAVFCLFCDCFNDLSDRYIPGKLRQNSAI